LNIFFNTIALPLSKKAVTGSISELGINDSYDVNAVVENDIDADGAKTGFKADDPAKSIIEK
ncbi:1013_t:CDS:1, partial [Ambispora leptoticha]